MTECNRNDFTELGGLTRWQESLDAGFGIPTGHMRAGKGWELAAQAIGIDWMKRAELTQAIPPVYTEHIGGQLLTMLRQG